MRNLLRITLLAVAITVASTPARAEPVQVIRVNVVSWKKAKVEGRVGALGALTPAIAKLSRRDERVLIKLFVPLGMNKTVVKKIMTSCREAGASSFFLVYKS
jgi:hypothetical protein